MSERNTWDRRSKEGLQAKKRVYVSRADFDRYGPELVDRWQRFNRYDVTAHALIDSVWLQCELPGGGS